MVGSISSPVIAPEVLFDMPANRSMWKGKDSRKSTARVTDKDKDTVWTGEQLIIDWNCSFKVRHRVFDAMCAGLTTFCFDAPATV